VKKPKRTPPASQELTADAAPPLCCSFCGKGHAELGVLIAGPKAHICSGCVVICVEVMFDAHKRDCAADTAAAKEVSNG